MNWTVAQRILGLLLMMFSVTMLPPVANAVDVVEQDVVIPTPDGMADAYLVHPASGKHPAVLVWTDVLSLRPAFRQMGRRLAQSGYSVLTPNPYYRHAKAPVISPGASWRELPCDGSWIRRFA